MVSSISESRVCRKCGSIWVELEGDTEHCRACGYMYEPEFPPRVGNLQECRYCGNAVEASYSEPICSECRERKDTTTLLFSEEDIEEAKKGRTCLVCLTPLKGMAKIVCQDKSCKETYKNYLRDKKAQDRGYKNHNHFCKENYPSRKKSASLMVA